MNIEEYLTGSEIQDICRDEIRKQVGKHLCDQNNLQRIISNQAYEIVYKMVDESIDGGLEQLLKGKVIKIVDNLSEFNVFKTPDAWSRETHSAYNILKKAIDSESDNIKRIVSENVESQALAALKSDLNDYIVDAVKDLFVNNEAER